MKSYHHKYYTPKHPVSARPMGELAGFPVRPGMFDINGATALPLGVNFTIGSTYNWSFSCGEE